MDSDVLAPCVARTSATRTLTDGEETWTSLHTGDTVGSSADLTTHVFRYAINWKYAHIYMHSAELQIYHVSFISHNYILSNELHINFNNEPD